MCMRNSEKSKSEINMIGRWDARDFQRWLNDDKRKESNTCTIPASVETGTDLSNR